MLLILACERGEATSTTRISRSDQQVRSVGWPSAVGRACPQQTYDGRNCPGKGRD